MPFPARCCRRSLSGLLALFSLLLVLITGLLPTSLAAVSPAPIGLPAATAAHPIRKVPGPSPLQTIDNFLELTAWAEAELRAALKQGMEEPGPFFSQAIQAQVDRAVDQLQQATQALDLSQIPKALRPMTGVGSMLQLRSLLRYDLSQSPGLAIPDQAESKRDHLQTWTLPDTPISLQAISPALARNGEACRQCSAGDFLFSSETLAQVPDDFDSVFAGDPVLRRKYGADLYTFWALLPGGAIPPKWFFRLDQPTRRLLLTPLWGQSLLQWLLLLPISLALVALLIWWLVKLRGWRQPADRVQGLWPHLLRVLAVLPLLVLLAFWQWYAIDWINLIGAREQAVLVGGRLFSGLLLALLAYLTAEATGQVITVVRRRQSDGAVLLERRKGSGQILTLTRIAGVGAALVVVVATGQDLGLTSLTLLGLASVPALAISLGTQQLIRDISDGFSLLLDGQIKPGDRCTIGTPKSGEIRGRLLSLGMRSMRIEQEDGSELSIPNSQVASSVVINHRFRTSQLLKLSLPITANEGQQVLILLSQARAILESTPELMEGRAELESDPSGWHLKLSGRWRPGSSSDELAQARETLHLQLMGLMQQDPESQAVLRSGVEPLPSR